MRLRKAGIDFQRPAVMADRPAEFSATEQGAAEVAMGSRKATIDLQGLLQVRDCRVELPTAGQGDAEIVVGLRVVRLDFKGPNVVGDALVDPSTAFQQKAEVVMGHPAAGVTSDRCLEYRLIVRIRPALAPGQSPQRDQKYDTNRGACQ